MGFTSLETPRLRLWRFTESDLPIIAAYRRDPDAQRFQNFREWTADEKQAFLTDMQLAQLDAPGAGLQIAVALRDTDALIGDVYVRISDPEQAEIGYTFAPEWRGQGYATEAVRGVFDYLFGTLNLHRIVAICADENSHSYALMERLGMRREAHMRKSYRYNGVWQNEFMYAILHEDWRQRA